MEEREAKWLVDILISIEEIETYFSIHEKSYESFQKNIILKRAIERNLEIIGEAMNRILSKNPTILISNARRIVGLRNQIIHGYDNISSENLWAIINYNIPQLKAEIEKIISGNS